MADTTKKTKQTKQKTAQMPAKKTMNFVHHQSSFSWKKVLPVMVIVIIAGLIFAKFGFLDPLEKKSAAYNELSTRQEQLALINAKLTGYDELAMEYGRYSYGWMNETEVNMVSRMDVLHLVEEEIANKAFIDNLAVNNNVLTMNIHGITLEQASAMVKRLEEKSLVESASVYNAVAEDAEKAEIFMSIVLTKEAE